MLSSSAHRYVTGGAFSRVDVFDDSVLATAVPLARDEQLLLDMPLDAVFALLRGEGAGGDSQTSEPVRF